MPSTIPATVFYNDAGEAAARVIVVAAPERDGEPLSPDELHELRLDCAIEGPRCRYSTTLTSRIKLKHRGLIPWGTAPAVMAHAILPDPCAWTAELPFLYRVVGTVKQGGRTVAELDQTFGIRPLNSLRSRIVLNGKTWVPRIVDRARVEPEASLDEWRDAATVMSVVEPDEALCRAADETGVILVASVQQTTLAAATSMLRRLSRHPSVAICVFEPASAIGPELQWSFLRSSAANTLLASRQSTAIDYESTGRVDLFVSDELPSGDGAVIPSLWSIERPIIAHRPIELLRSLEEARAACDALQAELAGKCHPTGYFV